MNHRFCRISVRLPAELAFFEERARRQIQARVQRGKVDFVASIEGCLGPAAGIDTAAAAAWAGKLEELSRDLAVAPATIGDLLALPGVLTERVAGADPEADGPLLEAALEAALEAFDEMRRREGEDLATDLRARIQEIRDGVAGIEEVSGEMPARVRDALRGRIAELLAEVGTAVDEDRIVQEAAYQAERADITEELVRLRSHLDKVDRLLAEGDAVGRTLEYLAQEIHRELSTIGAKTKELAIADLAIRLRAELEKVREQVQNLE